MNPNELLRSVDNLARERNIPREIIFSSIEKAIKLAILKRYDDEDGVEVNIDRDTGVLEARRDGEDLDVSELGRIPAMSGRNVMFQSFKEEESNSLFDAFTSQKGDLIHGTIQRFDGGTGIVGLGKTEALIPRGEQIPGETHHVGERVKAIILEVKRSGHRVRIILSRTHPVFVRRLFEEEIPEIQDQTISIRAVAREAGYRSKVAVSSIDMKVDCVGACVGVRGSRIKNIVDELSGERIDIVRWNDSLQVLILNALQPAQIEEVMLYPRLGRAIVLVQEDQLSLAIGRRGQNVRLASKLVGWDIEIMTHDELSEGIDKAETWFREIPGITDELVETFVEEGFLSFDDLTFVEPAELGELAGITEESAAGIIDYAEEAAERVEIEKQEQAAADAARPPAPAPAPQPTPSIFNDEESAPKEEAEPAPTLESLFGPETSEEADQVDESAEVEEESEATEAAETEAESEVEAEEAEAEPAQEAEVEAEQAEAEAEAEEEAEVEEERAEAEAEVEEVQNEETLDSEETESELDESAEEEGEPVVAAEDEKTEDQP